MKNIFIILALLFLTGCAEKFQSLVDDPGTILQDPDFTNYQQRLDSVEKEYLDKKITYAEYLERKNKIEEDYARQTKEQKQSLEDPQYFKEQQHQDETLR
jgi:hypothetical protein